MSDIETCQTKKHVRQRNMFDIKDKKNIFDIETSQTKETCQTKKHVRQRNMSDKETCHIKKHI